MELNKLGETGDSIGKVVVDAKRSRTEGEAKDFMLKFKERVMSGLIGDRDPDVFEFEWRRLDIRLLQGSLKFGNGSRERKFQRPFLGVGFF